MEFSDFAAYAVDHCGNIYGVTHTRDYIRLPTVGGVHEDPIPPRDVWRLAVTSTPAPKVLPGHRVWYRGEGVRSVVRVVLVTGTLCYVMSCGVWATGSDIIRVCDD